MRNSSGFTLIELLVVISIIAILAGLSMSMILSGGEAGRVSAEETRLQQLTLRAKSYETEHGDYPPSDLADSGVKTDGVNAGIESLYAHLQSRKGGGPFIDDVSTDDRANTDGDRFSKAQLEQLRSRLDWAGEGDQIFELVDLWGNPYVYLHSRDYKRPGQLKNRDGQLFTVQAAKDPDTGGYINPTSFQIWSLGPDGINQNGEGDDVCAWKRN